MNILAPSILSADFACMGDEIRKVDEAGAEYIHIDVMDGMFVPSISYGMPVIKSLRKVTKRVFDVHLMVEEPIRYIKEFVESGADLITVHVEACKDVKATLELIKSYGIKCAISLNPKTPVSEIEPYIDMVDMVLVMSVQPGFGGQKFIDGSIEKIAKVRQLLNDRNLNHVDVEVDGGINEDNIADVVSAGANIVVAGSAVFKGDAYANSIKLIERMKEAK